jgi:hypothetical protein
MSDPADDPLSATASTAPTSAGQSLDTSGITTRPKAQSFPKSQFTCSDTVKHIVTEILRLPDPPRILYILAENGFLDGNDLLMLSEDAVDDLTVVPYQGQMIQTTLLERIKLKTIVAFHDHYAEKYGLHSLGQSEWLTFNYPLWFIWNNEAVRASKAAADVSAPAETPRETRTPVENWNYGVKKNIGDYSSFEDAKFWHTWKQETVQLGKLHVCSEVFDPTYKPSTTDEQQLFNIQETFMMSVFVKYVKVTEGRNIVLGAGDSAQNAWAGLLKRYEQSSEALVDTQMLRQKIQSMKLDSTWQTGEMEIRITFFEYALSYSPSHDISVRVTI